MVSSCLERRHTQTGINSHLCKAATLEQLFRRESRIRTKEPKVLKDQIENQEPKVLEDLCQRDYKEDRART